MKRITLGALGVLLLFALQATQALAHHQADDVPDNSNPDNTSRNGQICSASAQTPGGGDFQQTINGFTYLLRWSSNCRSVWERSVNTAPRRTDMVTRRLPDSNWAGYCTGNTHYSGDTYYWTGQVDDKDHFARVRIDDSGHDCAGSATWVSDQF